MSILTNLLSCLKKPKLKDTDFGGDTAFIWTMADWQLGKADYGVENTLKRYDIALREGKSN